jgi:hypothetical protein
MSKFLDKATARGWISSPQGEAAWDNYTAIVLNNGGKHEVARTATVNYVRLMKWRLDDAIRKY